VVAEDPAPIWKPATIADWYVDRKHTVEIAFQRGVWYDTSLFAVPECCVLAREAHRCFQTQALFHVPTAILIYRRSLVGL
jgi:hypothetical protein